MPIFFLAHAASYAIFTVFFARRLRRRCVLRVYVTFRQRCFYYLRDTPPIRMHALFILAFIISASFQLHLFVIYAAFTYLRVYYRFYATLMLFLHIVVYRHI